MKILDIGCGNNKYPDAVGMDLVKLPNVDVVHSFLNMPYPFESESFDMVVMQHQFISEKDGYKTRAQVQTVFYKDY